ncbi:hypothetical protein BB560_006918 [Smittium megazygosporum]|uniref:Uncharacterized protein n=1 Tax=Smittium megazygosporum TaxID=133381 RepID=A0A2T9Y099_9FUNG|nr:hypothetical protein BB560_006918 [Smittium megazygosporum]
MRNTGSWMDLQMRHPDIKLGLQDIGKIRMGCYWTVQRLAKARCPFCNKNTSETIEHMLLECFRWNSIRRETTIFNIPRLYRTLSFGAWIHRLKKVTKNLRVRFISNDSESQTAISGLGRRVGQLDAGQTENAEYEGTEPDQSPHIRLATVLRVAFIGVTAFSRTWSSWTNPTITA